MLYLIPLSILLVRTLAAILKLTGLWQAKEYRIDRLVLHYRFTQAGIRDLTRPESFLRWILMPFAPTLPQLLAVGLLSLLELPEVLSFFHEVTTHSVRKPKKITLRTILIVLLAIITLIYIFSLPQKIHGISLALFLVDRSTWAAVALSVVLTSIPSTIVKKITIFKAFRKRNKFIGLKTIGITGSVGKTTTKEFTKTILSTKYNTVATKDHDNTEIGIARRILHDITPQIEVFIAEMGAYKRGEIRSLARLVQPQIGILTGVGVQHLELFQSHDNIKRAKYELIESLTGEKIAIFNLDSPVSAQLSKITRDRPGFKVLTYSSINHTADFYSTAVRQTRAGINFSLHHGRENHKTHAKLFGSHFVLNILAGACVASELGMSLREIAQAITTISPPADALHLQTHPSGSLIFDDTYNASPESVSAAVNLLSELPGIKRKIMILQPLIELGEEAEKTHFEIGKLVRDGKLDTLVLTNQNFLNAISSGAGDKSKSIVSNTSPIAFAKILATYLSPHTAVVFKGKESSGYLKVLLG